MIRMKEVLMLVMFGFFLSVKCFAQKIVINHGPYLQELTSSGVTFVFSTSLRSVANVEIRRKGDKESFMCYQSKHGLRNADSTFYAVRTERLEPGVIYQYRVHVREIKSFQPYKVIFGDSIVSDWHTFQTVNKEKKGGTLFITSDIHSDPEKLEKLLKNCDYQTCTAFFYAGDMMNYMHHGEEHPYTSFIDKSVELFASSVPFELVRGNHETRGDMARVFPSFFPKTNGHIYGSYLLGDVMIIMLDSGEDKSDAYPVYAGLTDYNNYRSEQVRWLEALLQSEEYEKAKYHIVISHFPMVMGQTWKDEKIWCGWQDAIDKFLPILNSGKIDLSVSGHTHRFYYHKLGEDGNLFPVLEQGAMCATRLELYDGKVHVKVVDVNGKILMDKIL